jgi:RNA polymerase sigma-70 factor (ECF subfamily)
VLHRLDSSLLERAQAGDPAAFEQLIGPHVASVRRFALAFSRHWSDADDLAQEALLKAFDALASFEGRASLGTWLYAITRNVCHDFYRGRLAQGRKREDVLDDDDSGELHPDSQDRPDELLVAKTQAELLWLQIKDLPPEFRVPLVLHEIEGLAYEEIAKIERVPVGTIRSRLSRARQRLKEALRAGAPASVPPPGTETASRPSHRGNPPP